MAQNKKVEVVPVGAGLVGGFMGNSPATSVVTRYGQTWDTPNIFVVGISQFPQNPGVNPTGTVAGVVHLASDGIVYHYVNDPGDINGDSRTSLYGKNVTGSPYSPHGPASLHSDDQR